MSPGGSIGAGATELAAWEDAVKWTHKEHESNFIPQPDNAPPSC